MRRGGIFLLIFALFAFVTLGQSAQAARFTGAYLLELCEKDQNGKELVKGGHAICQSYIAGIIDTHNMMRSLSRGDLPSAEFCIPPGTTLNTLHDVILGYLRNNDQHDNFIASPALVTAFFQKYPC